MCLTESTEHDQERKDKDEKRKKKSRFYKDAASGADTGSIYASKCKCGTKNKSVGKQRQISLLLQSEGQKSKE